MNFLAGGVLMVARAYDWLGNVAHEIIGTVMSALLIAHSTFNRHWFSRASKGGRNLRGWVKMLVIVALLSTMLALLVTSLLISRSVFGFLQLSGGYIARQIHGLAAYWALIIVSVHVGIGWSMIMPWRVGGSGSVTRAMSGPLSFVHWSPPLPPTASVVHS